jgi:signal transduction histidine kinase
MRWRSSLLVTPLLVVSLVITALLALQAHGNFVYHRATAERALRDFASLAGGELVRRSTAQVGYDGYLVLLTGAARGAGPQGLGPDLPRRLAQDPDPRVRRAAGLARRFFVAAPGSGRIELVPPAPPRADEARRILARLQARVGGVAGAFAVVHAVADGRPQTLVVARAPAPPWELLGFEVDLDQLGGWFQEAFDRGPLLPPSLGRGRVTNDALGVVVRDHAGTERFRAGGGPWPPLVVEVPFGPAYSGVLEGSTVEVSIDPGAARSLVIGGLPRSRLPLLLGLLALCTVLVAVATLQLRRERALQRLRSEFVSSVSHELRTPLTQIRMFAETLLLDRVRSEDERRRALEIVDREARRLTHLVENMLQFSRGERGGSPLAPRPQPLVPLAREVIDQFQPMVAGSGVRLVPRLDEATEDGGGVALVDADAVRQVLLNLLDNAVKYGPRQQEVVVALQRAPGALRLAVEDQGPGIPAPERRRVFERFHRLDRDRRSSIAGTGIGLSVVRDLVERQGGRVWVEDGSGGGARFVVELPAAEP